MLYAAFIDKHFTLVIDSRFLLIIGIDGYALKAAPPQIFVHLPVLVQVCLKIHGFTLQQFRFVIEFVNGRGKLRLAFFVVVVFPFQDQVISLTLEQCADVLFSFMLSALLRQDYDPAPVLEIIRRTLY